MKSGDTEALKTLLKQYEEDGSALWLYTRSLIAFRESEAGDEKAEELARNAWKANSHVPAALAGTKEVKPSTDGHITIGGEDEAANYVTEWGFRLAHHASPRLVRLTGLRKWRLK